MSALAGIRIADFSHVMAGPFASHFLCLLGAEVIKVEPPGVGDPMRNYGSDRSYDGMAPGFIAANPGKKSIVLDLKSADGLAVARKLIATSDVVLENFRPGVMARIGLGFDTCRALRSDIIFCSISGYGQSGPLRDYPAIDNIVQATSGLMSVSGEPEGPYTRIGFPAVDTYTGTLGALAILAALLRKRDTGEGQFIDLAMFDASLVMMTSVVSPFLVTGAQMPRTGNTGYSGQPTASMFTCKDGAQISLGVVQQVQFERLCAAMERRDWLADPRFAAMAARQDNANAMRAALAVEFLKRNGEDWERALSAEGAPCGLVRDIAGALAMPHLRQRGALEDKSLLGLPRGERAVALLNAGFQATPDGPHVPDRPPLLGEHGDEVLKALGYGEAERARLIASGAVGKPRLR